MKQFDSWCTNIFVNPKFEMSIVFMRENKSRETHKLAHALTAYYSRASFEGSEEELYESMELNGSQHRATNLISFKLRI